MAVTSFASATQATPEGMVLVGILSNHTGATNAGNTRYINASLKQNTQYVFRYYPAQTATSYTFPAIDYHKNATKAYGTLIPQKATTANNTFEDLVHYNTESGITQIMFNTSGAAQTSGFVAIYEQVLSKSANYYASDLFSYSTTTIPTGLVPTSGWRTQFPSYALYSTNTTTGIWRTMKLTSGGKSWQTTGSAGGVATWAPNPCVAPSGRLWTSTESSSQYMSATTLYYSDNQGSSWTTKTVTQPGDGYHAMIPPAYSPVNGGMLFTFRAGAMGNRSMYSTDNGATWTTGSSPYGSNQGSGAIVLGFSGGFLLFSNTGSQGDTHTHYKTTNGTTFTAFTSSNRPSNFIDFWWGVYKVTDGQGYEAYIGGFSQYTYTYYVASSPDFTYNAFNGYVSLPISAGVLNQQKSFWTIHQENSATGQYYTQKYSYVNGSTIPMVPTNSWTLRTNSANSSHLPLPNLRTGTDESIYFTPYSTASTSASVATVTPAGFTAL